VSKSRGTWILTNSLWLVSAGLMLSSSGIDGAYMAKIVPWPIVGYVLNTVSDIGSEVLMYWFGRLRQYPKNTKRYKMAAGVLFAESILTGYAWLFGWRQLLPIITALEDAQTAAWLAPVLAAFTPISLVAIGYTQALLAGRIEKEQGDSTAEQEQPQVEQVEAQSESKSAKGNGHSAHQCPWCERGFASQQAVSAHLRFCDAYQAEQAEAPIEESGAEAQPAPAPQQGRATGAEEEG